LDEHYPGTSLPSWRVSIRAGGFGVFGGILGCETGGGATGLDDVSPLPSLFTMINSDYNNSKLAYEYTKVIWDRTNSSYDVVTTKLTTSLGFSGLLLRFAADLSDSSWLIHIKLGICVLLTGAVIFCGIGLHPIGTGEDVVEPDTYLEDETEEIYSLPEESSYLYIARGLSKSIKNIEKNRHFRVKCLSFVTYFLGIAVIGFATSIIGKAVI
jgi:hypothetical protein